MNITGDPTILIYPNVSTSEGITYSCSQVISGDEMNKDPLFVTYHKAIKYVTFTVTLCKSVSAKNAYLLGFPLIGQKIKLYGFLERGVEQTAYFN